MKKEEQKLQIYISKTIFYHVYFRSEMHKGEQPPTFQSLFTVKISHHSANPLLQWN